MFDSVDTVALSTPRGAPKMRFQMVGRTFLHMECVRPTTRLPSPDRLGPIGRGRVVNKSRLNHERFVDFLYTYDLYLA